MGWVTLDDGQHVFIGAGGKVLASRSKISSAGGAKEHGKALAARSKAAIGRAVAGKKKPSVKPAGPGQAREMARSQFKVAEKIRTGKMADAALKTRYAREDALKAKLNAPKPAAAPVRPKISEPPRTVPDAKGNFHVPDKQLGKAVSTGTTKEGMATFSWDKPSTSRAIEHARAAGPATIGHTPGEKFSLIQRSATGSKGAENTGRGTTKFMFDMKKGDKPGQTSLLDKAKTAAKTQKRFF